MDYDDKQRLCQDPQRLSGRDTVKSVCDSPNLIEKLGEGNNKTFRQLKKLVSKHWLKVTESRQTEDELTRDRLLSTMSQVNCTGGSNGDNPTELTFSDTVNTVKQLRSNNAYEFMDGIIGENRIGTSPTRDSYLAMGSTQLQGQFENIPQFTYKWNYPSIQSTMPSEYGAIANVRFLLSSIGAKLPNASANGADVYPLIVIGRESYCIVEQDRYSSSFIYRPPIFSSPLALNATVGWKMAYAGVITNDAWVFLLNSTLS